jgi:hypothetical protein
MTPARGERELIEVLLQGRSASDNFTTGRAPRPSAATRSSLASSHPEVLPVAAVGWATLALRLATALFGNVIEFWSLPSATHCPPGR